jgi:hypothetical protein
VLRLIAVGGLVPLGAECGLDLADPCQGLLRFGSTRKYLFVLFVLRESGYPFAQLLI